MRTWVCPYSGESYIGACPITQCPANISTIPDRPSGCFHNFLDNKPNITKFEIAYAFKSKHKDVDNLITQGRKAIEKLALLRVILNEVRHYRLRNCSRCGIVRSTGGDCINTIRCASRARLMQRVLRRHPFNIRELAVTNADIFRILHRRKELLKLIKSYNDTLGVKSILRLPRKLAHRLFAQPTEV